MATSKGQPVSTSSTNARSKDDIPGLKNRVIELERQVNEYRMKLDELRRAKATTVVKLEKEYVNTSAPGANRPEKSKSCEKCEELEKTLDAEKKANAQLRRSIDEKAKAKQDLFIKYIGTDLHRSQQHRLHFNTIGEEQQLVDEEKEKQVQLKEKLLVEKKQTEEERNAKEFLHRTLDITHGDLVEANNLAQALTLENLDYKNALEKMKQEYSDKMADLCQREEEAKKQVANWEQMYRQWMATMERRVDNLQVTDGDFQTWLHDDNERSPHRRPDDANDRNPRR